MNLKDEVATYMAMVYPEGIEPGSDQHRDVEAAFIAGAYRAASILIEANGVRSVVDSIARQAEEYVDAGIAAELAKNKRN